MSLELRPVNHEGRNYRIRASISGRRRRYKKTHQEVNIKLSIFTTLKTETERPTDLPEYIHSLWMHTYKGVSPVN